MLLLNVIVIAFLLFSTNLLTRIIRIPTRFLGMIILTLSFVGVYSLRHSTTDCAVASVFGIFGLVLKRLDLPAVPIVLGMVLGGIMEVRLPLVHGAGQTPLDSVDRPVSAILAALVVVVIAAHVRTLIREHRTRLANDDVVE